MRSTPRWIIPVLCAFVTCTDASATTAETIGESRQGRPIRAIHTGTAGGPTILVVGCIHGNECAARALVMPLIRARVAADLWIVPTLNPDGFVRHTRQNAAGVDLNRNWPRRWRRSGRPWSTYYSGPRVSSEPETVAGRRFIARIRPRVTIWYHQHMNLIWASGSSIPAGRIYARAAAMRMRTDDRLRGTATGWQRTRLPGTRAFVVELPAGHMTRPARTRHVRAIRELAASFAPPAGPAPPPG